MGRSGTFRRYAQMGWSVRADVTSELTRASHEAEPSASEVERTSGGQPPRLRTIAARDLAAVRGEIAKVKNRFGLHDDAEVVSCYEAGRDRF